MKRVADTRKPPVVIPVVVVPVDVHVALVIPAVEGDQSCDMPSIPLLIEGYSDLRAVSYAAS